MTDVIVQEKTVQVYSGDLTDEVFSLALSETTIAWDIETSGLNWATDRIGTCQIATRKGIAVVVLDEGARPELLGALLESPHVKKVFHHAPFDLRFMAKHWGLSPQNVACTKIASKILDPDLEGPEHSLKPVLRRHLGVEIGKEEQVSDWLAPELSDSQLRYAASDVAYLVRLAEVLESKCRSAGVSAELFDSYEYLPARVKLDLRGVGDVYVY